MNKKILAREMIGAYVCFDGNENNQQVSRLKSGAEFTRQNLAAFVRWSWVWHIDINFIYEKKGFSDVSDSFEITTDKAVKLDDLTDLILKYQTRCALQLDGYRYKTKQWTATIKKGAI